LRPQSRQKNIRKAVSPRQEKAAEGAKSATVAVKTKQMGGDIVNKNSSSRPVARADAQGMSRIK